MPAFNEIGNVLKQKYGKAVLVRRLCTRHTHTHTDSNNVDYVRFAFVLTVESYRERSVGEEKHHSGAQERAQRPEGTENTRVGRVEGIGAHTKVAQLL